MRNRSLLTNASLIVAVLAVSIAAASANTLDQPVDPQFYPSAQDATDWVLEIGTTSYYWSASLQLFLDKQTGQLYNPATDHWFDPETRTWHPHEDSDQDASNSENDAQGSNSLSEEGAAAGRNGDASTSENLSDPSEAIDGDDADGKDASGASTSIQGMQVDVEGDMETEEVPGDKDGNAEEKLWELPTDLTDWVLDAVEPELYWSESAKLFFDRVSGHFYDPESEKWYDWEKRVWYKLDGENVRSDEP